jgi:hypothetical protein
MALFFGLIWFALHTAPVLVAGYESPRHVYLASLGWAFAIGLALESALEYGRLRFAAWAAVAGVLVFYTVQLRSEVAEWGSRARVSRTAVVDLQREARGAPPGTLIVAAAPVRSWEWAAPFVLRRPFTVEELEPRVRLITPQLLHCCRAQWEAYTRASLRAWLTGGGEPHAVVLRWDATTGALFRITDAEEPYLRELFAVLADTDSPEALDRGIRELAERLPAARQGQRPGVRGQESGVRGQGSGLPQDAGRSEQARD